MAHVGAAALGPMSNLGERLVLNRELDGMDLVTLHAATQRRIEERLTARRFPAPPT
jgi:hypothetical protein